MGIRVMDSNDQERERGITILAKVRNLLRCFKLVSLFHISHSRPKRSRRFTRLAFAVCAPFTHEMFV